MHAADVLEFSAILSRLQTHCETALGADLAADLEPSFDAPEIWASLDLTRQAHDVVATGTPPSLRPVHDLRAAVMVAAKGGSMHGQDLYDVGGALAAMRATKSFLTSKRGEAPRLWAFAESMPEQPRLEERLVASLEPNGDVKDGASPVLGDLRRKVRSATARIQERIQSYATGKTRDLLSDPIFTVRDGRYVVPLKAENRGKIKGVVHDTSATGATLFVEPEEILQMGNALREIETAIRTEIIRILADLSAKVGAVANEIVGGIEACAHLDLAYAKSKLGFEMKGSLPQPLKGHRIELQGARHPLLDPQIAVPLDIALGIGDSVLVTGPNTGGKTVAIKAVGLAVLMAQSGLLPPAINVRLGPFTQVWADIGDEQSLQQSLSTFSGHLKNIAEALKGLKTGALALLDEVGAGTDPAEGAALARAIVQAMHDRGATVLASTHYGELKAFAFSADGFKNAAMEFDSKSLRPTYRLTMGAAGSSHAMKIAERYGIPAAIVASAKDGLSEQQQDVAAMLEKLDQAQRLARKAQGDADRRMAELKIVEERAAKKLVEADEVRRTVHSKGAEAIEAMLRELRLEASALFEELKSSALDPKVQESVRRRLKELQEAGREIAGEIQPQKVQTVLTSSLESGMQVKLDGYTQIGTLLTVPKDGVATVQMGILKMTVPLAEIRPVGKSQPEPKKASTNIRLERALNASTEIHLRHMRAEEAERDLEKFIDDAVLGGLHAIRIVHGKGEGVLRSVTRDVLRRHPHIDSFRDGEPGEGGHGVTVAKFK